MALRKIRIADSISRKTPTPKAKAIETLEILLEILQHPEQEVLDCYLHALQIHRDVSSQHECSG